MSKHKHCHCEHDLKYCSCCDTVYCTKCEKEWGNWGTTFTYTGSPVYTNGTGILEVANCNHNI